MFLNSKCAHVLAASCSRRILSTSNTALKQPDSLKGLKKSSQEWLIRQLKDPYVEKAKLECYRCRSAFKLIEMDDKYHILGPGKVVVDCGASPGSWTQVAVKRCNSDKKDLNFPTGAVIGLDILQIFPIPGATLLSGMDFTKPDAKTRLLKALDGKLVDVFLSDMAPNASGVKSLDHDKIVEMAYHALHFTVKNCKVDGSFVVKIWNGSQSAALKKDMERFFKSVRVVKPAASRCDSAEIYFFGQGFKGLQS